MKSYYDILELPIGASEDEIKQAYRRLAMKHHPDRNANSKVSEEKFKLIKKAYEELTNPNYKYVPPTKQPDPVRPAQRYSNILKNVVPDASIEVTLENIESGVLARAFKKTLCPACNGTGVRNPYGSDSRGYVDQFMRRYMEEKPSKAEDTKCGPCKGTGEVVDFDCYFDIPSGVPNNVVMKLECRDSNGRTLNKTRNIKIKELSHSRLDRKGNDLYGTMFVNKEQLTEGGKETFYSLNNKKLLVSIPQALESKTVLKLRGCGLPDLQTKELGDLYLTLKT